VSALRRLLLLVFAVLLLAAPAGAAQTSLADIEDEVMCPVCGVALNIAEQAPQAQDQRRFIRNLIAEGKTKDEIKRALVVEYGEGVLGMPSDDGFKIANWLVPALVVATLVAVLLMLVPRWRRRTRARRPAADAGPELSSSDAQRLDEDLARYR